ncbi:2-dehydropantoate 2-reductase [Halapricum sp. CBA1109]|uniref:ketopantoate reductase family protein n=1 Tax=Halapricum sp. CBA1109 TaxID=2668068 RepID=UPI0012FBA117|nr:2-dehydropantoate 2-reductase [Halapricum sp. CBA1109]MUV90087.1 2-dehydropantoate 2-reductase [Halapricum sp. CBA1109]
MSVVVLGAGSLGSLLGGLLADAHDVTLVGREPHVGTVAAEGLTITGELDRRVFPDARTDLPASADLALVAVKSGDTAAAARELADSELGAVLSVQNGMGNEETLAERLDCPVLAGTCTYGALLTDPGVVRCTGVGEVVLGPREGGTSAAADRAGETLRTGGIETTVAPDMPRRLWEKLAVNAGINATTALARVENGALVDGPAGDPAREAARETARVARAQGVDLPDEVAVESLVDVAAGTVDNTSSMLADVLADRETEIEAINGYVVDAAERPVPVNATLTALVRGLQI